ncbi:hypothetical protein ACQY0O_000690 [Thecaphora frezii]
MSQPLSVTLDIIFAAIYVVLFILALICGFKQGFKRATGFFSLVLFTAVKLAGNVLLVYDYHDNYSNTNLIITGYLLRGLGYSFLVTSVIAFLTAVYNAELGGGSKKPFLLKILHIANTVALILLIMGYTKSDSVFNGTSSTGKLDAKAPIGEAIFATITVLCFLFTLGIWSRSPPEQRQVLACVATALPLMGVRIAFGLYKTSRSHFLTATTTWQNVGFEYIEEVLSVLALLAVALVRSKMGKAWDEEVPLSYAGRP